MQYTPVEIMWICILIVVPIVVLRLLNRIYKKHKPKKNTLIWSFAKNIVEAVVVVSCFLTALDKLDKSGAIRTNVLMSSSVIAIVLGIVFQTGLENVIHGIIIVIFKPFNVGDRVQVDAGNGISGYVKQITLRHVVVTNIIDNSDMIIPNSVMDSSVIKNLSNGIQEINKYTIIVSMCYEQAMVREKRELAKKIISDCILANGYTVDVRPDKTKDLFVKVDYAASSVDMTCFVVTKTAEDNVVACSEIKEAILDRFGEAGLEFAYNHIQVVMQDE